MVRHGAGGRRSNGDPANDGSRNHTTLKSFAVGQTPVEMRIRRSGPTLHFESGADGQWFSFHQAEVGTNATGLEGGLFMTTSEPVPSRVLVDYAMLVDPSQTSDLVLSLRPTEIMYHPLEPSEVEYVELTNTGATTIDLAGGQFIEGINYVFAPNRFWMLGPGERIVVTNDRDAFLAFTALKAFDWPMDLMMANWTMQASV